MHCSSGYFERQIQLSKSHCSKLYLYKNEKVDEDVKCDHIVLIPILGSVHNQPIVKYQSEVTDDSTDVDNDTYNNSNLDDDDDDDDYDSLEYHFASYGFQALRLFRKFIMKLDNLKYLHYILFNWLTGNQLIIKYQNRTEDKDFIRAFISVFRVRMIEANKPFD